MVPHKKSPACKTGLTLAGRAFALGWVGKKPPANSENCGNGNVPSRITRDRTANEANDQADNDAYQEPNEPPEEAERCHLRWLKCFHPAILPAPDKRRAVATCPQRCRVAFGLGALRGGKVSAVTRTSWHSA